MQKLKMSVENQELTYVLLLKPGVGQSIAMHALPTARNFFFVLIPTFMVHSPSFSFQVGMQKVLSFKEERRDPEVT